MLRVLFDAQKFDEQRVGGATRYWARLMAALEKVSAVQPELAVRVTTNAYVGNKSSIWPLPRRWLNRRLSVRLLQQGDFDIFHPTYFNPYYLGYLHGKPYVVTVFDMIHERLPEYFPRTDMTRAWKETVVRGAAAIVAISERTRTDLLELLDVPPEKIAVVPLATDIGQVVPEEVGGVQTRFVLYVGQRGKYKNFFRLVRALSPILRAHRELALVCAGGGLWRPEERALLSDAGVDERVMQFDVSDRQLAYLYRQARLLVYPSLYEGFGLPVLEALACCCPVAASNAGALPEVGGEAAAYFDPRDEGSMRAVIEHLLVSESTRRSLVDRGSRRVKLFSWDRVARQTAAVYERVVEHIHA